MSRVIKNQRFAYAQADQHLCFCYIASTMPLLSKPKSSRLYPSSVSLFCVGPGRKQERWFSHDAAHMYVTFITNSRKIVMINYIIKMYLIE